MICKECGAYNPDHATYCKVCAANLKVDPEVQAPVAAEEEPQPTKRFMRPSWIPEQSEPVKQTVREAAEEVEEQAASVEQPVEKVQRVAEEPVEEPVEEPAEEPEAAGAEEETPVQIWSPAQTRRKPAPVREEPEEAEEPLTLDEDEDSIYNDEEALEDSEDPFEYEPTPPKRKQQKKKNNTLFTVLLIAIIVVIVGILVVGGYILITKLSGKDKLAPASQNAEQTEPVDLPGEQPGTTETQPTEAPASLDSHNAQLQELVENNNDLVAITVVVPGKSTVTIDFPNQDDYSFTNSEDKDITRKVKIPVEVFYPNQPLEQPTVEFRPDITITNADGSSYKVDCPAFTRTFPKLNITVTNPIAGEDGMIMAPESNVISVTGNIDDSGATVTINDVETVIYDGGYFMYDFKFADDATEDTEETIRIAAKKNNAVGDTKEITVHAYKFVPEAMKLEVKSDGASLQADKNGKLTVTGTTLPGATLTATSDNTTNVLCGSVNVDGEGNFSFQVTMDTSFYGMSTITLNAEKEGAESGSTKFTVTRGFADKETFLKYYNKTKSYHEIPKAITIQELLANTAQYASNAYGFRITATVVEVLTVDGDTVVKMTLNKTNEVVYVHNLSEKWAPADNVGTKYNVYCNFAGTYEDTGCGEFLGWFAKKA